MRRRGTIAATLLAACALAAAPASGAESPCSKADALLAGGALDAARKEYEAALAKPDSTGCVVAGLRGVDDAARNRSLDLAKQLDKRGLDAEVRALLVETLKKYPDTRVPDSLDHLLTRDRTPRWERFLDRAAPVARSVGEVLLVLLVAAVAAQFVFSRVHRRLRIGEFTGPATEAKATAVSTEIQALVRARIDKVASAQPGGRVDLAAPAGGPIAIPATVTQAAPQAKIVEALLQLVQHLFPANDRTLTGQLLVASPRGLGVVVTLNSRWGGPRATRTIWADDLPPAAVVAAEDGSYLPFVVAVAAWTLAEFRPRRFRALGTSDPLSYAAFSVGAAEQGATW